MDSRHIEFDPIIGNEQALRKLVPGYPKIMDKRLQPELDRYCLELISLSRLAVIGFGDDSTSMQVVATQSIVVLNPTTLSLRVRIPPIAETGTIAASLYFLIPGVGHSLRVNGEIRTKSGSCTLTIRCAYLHCARAAARAGLWNDSGRLDTAPINVASAFIKACPYLLIKTVNKNYETELSPRGDYEGFVRNLGGGKLFIPERPGNKVAVSMRNIIANENIELLMLIPGSDAFMTVRGKAYLSANPELLSKCSVNGKRPKLGIVIEITQSLIRGSDTINSKTLWSKDKHIEAGHVTRFPKALSVHMNGSGVLGKAAAPIIGAVVKNDMNNLY